ncbi:MAG: hypothetical protein CR996_00810 [Draconibacterium sp.]|nr:MAG: hypothetical protein CR996_00810 [Draconibacterium sp.]
MPLAKTITSWLAATVFLLALIVNIQVTYSGVQVVDSIVALATGSNNTDDGTCSYVPPGYGCANKVLFPLQLTIQQPCTKKKYCFLYIAETAGVEQICQTNSQGGRCSQIACDAPEPECW